MGEELNLLFIDQLPGGIYGIMDKLQYINCADLPVHATGFDFLEIEHLVDQTRQALNLIDHNAKEIAALFRIGFWIIP